MTEYVKIKNIEKLETNYDLYDIETKNHNFYANDVLVHNSNGAVCYNVHDNLWVQSRSNIITVENDNQGCAMFVERTRTDWLYIIDCLASEHDIDLENYTISIYFEFCGGNIQKNSAVSGLDKRAIIFEHFKVSPIEVESDESAKWYKTLADNEWTSNPSTNIFNIMDFPTHEFDINFNSPELFQNDFIKMVERIEEESPVGKQFGKDGNIGEGFVFSHLTENNELIQFKVKGEKHSNSKVKTLKEVDLEKLGRLDKFVESICHSWRFEQALTEVFGSDYEKNLDRRKLGEYLKWVGQDTVKEESDLIVESGFEMKEVMQKVNQKAKNYFMQIEQL